MEIRLYNTNSDNRTVHKRLSNERILNGQLLEDTDVITPTIKITYIDTVNYNYAYIPAFGRYYYITGITVDEGQNITISLSCDVLMSFWDDFKNSQCIAERSTSKYNEYITDKMVAFSPKIRTDYRKLPFNFSPTESGNHYVLTLGGNI